GSVTGLGSDSYVDIDNTTQTISDTVTTSIDNFDLVNWHSMYWNSASAQTAGDGEVDAFGDTGNDTATMAAQGVKSSGGDVYTFAQDESSYDFFTMNESDPGQWDENAGQSETLYTWKNGNNWTDAFGHSQFSYNLGSVSSSACDEGGDTTYWA